MNRPYSAIENLARWAVTGIPHATANDAVRLSAYVYELEQENGRLEANCNALNTKLVRTLKTEAP